MGETAPGGAMGPGTQQDRSPDAMRQQSSVIATQRRDRNSSTAARKPLASSGPVTSAS